MDAMGPHRKGGRILGDWLGPKFYGGVSPSRIRSTHGGAHWLDAAYRVSYANTGRDWMLIKDLQKTVLDATGKGFDLTECDDIVTMLRSRGYKLTQREATDRMLEACEEVENPARAWSIMWDESE